MESLIKTIPLLLDPMTLGALVLGTVFGMVVGALPGLGSILAITMVLPFTFAMDQVPAIALVLAVYCSSVFGGSISAILINTPGTPQSAATVLDGYPMARRGEADRAFGWAATGSLIGGLVSTVILMVAAPSLAGFALNFGSIETFALIALAMTCIIGVSRGSILKGLFAGTLGLFLATIGTDQMSGAVRFDFGVFQLSGGIDLVPAVVGLFAFAEVFSRIAERKSGGATMAPSVGFRLPPLIELARRWRTTVKSALIGTFVGILPGTGAATASFIAYSEAKRSGRYREAMGTGEPEGILASETSNNAVTGGALVPTLALGIPGDPVTAVMMSALIIQGIQPGVRLFVDNPEIMDATFMALILANVIMFFVAWLAAPVMTRVLRLPEPVLLTIVLVLSVVGAYGASGRMFDVWLSLGFGVVGFLFRVTNIPVAPIVIGMVLGPIFETNLRQGLLLTDGSFLAFFGPDRPIATLLAGLTLVILVMAFRGEYRDSMKARQQKAVQQ